ncbi:MAG: DUF3987 domain-containing protein [Paludibacteraceae bacterium]|nr:DUF3987 domain-containing protein [Paludibacteraceae bacterium]
MVQNSIHFTECDDLQITSHLNMEALPQILQDLLSVAHTTEQKDMLLMSSLTTLSTVMNSVYFRYGTTGKRYYPELMTFIMAGAASGKGIAELSKRLVEKVHEDTPLIIAGDSTYPAFYQQLLDQDGCGLLFETEGSVITDIWKGGAMSYNTALRKAAEHETLSKNRLNSGQTEIACPKVGMMLTGTFSQFKALVPSVENGFFSRLMTVVVREHQDFDGSVFQPSEEGKEVEALVERLAMQVKRMAERLEDGTTCLQDGAKHLQVRGEIEFRLTAEQASLLGQVMEKEYKEYVRVLGDGFHASVVRNGINVMRIAAILTALRHCSSLSSTNVSDISESLTCSEADFQTAMVIGTKLLLHAADAYNQIAAADREAVPTIKGSYQKNTFFVSLPNSFSTGECLSIADKMGISERSTKRWLSQWAEQGQLTHTHGVYEKIA